VAAVVHDTVAVVVVLVAIEKVLFQQQQVLIQLLWAPTALDSIMVIQVLLAVIPCMAQLLLLAVVEAPDIMILIQNLVDQVVVVVDLK
jgi:hypothetical protein